MLVSHYSKYVCLLIDVFHCKLSIGSTEETAQASRGQQYGPVASKPGPRKRRQENWKLETSGRRLQETDIRVSQQARD